MFVLSLTLPTDCKRAASVHFWPTNQVPYGERGLSWNDGRDHLCASAQDPFWESQAHLLPHTVKTWKPSYPNPPCSLFQMSSACYIFCTTSLQCLGGNSSTDIQSVVNMFLGSISWAFPSFFFFFSPSFSLPWHILNLLSVVAPACVLRCIVFLWICGDPRVAQCQLCLFTALCCVPTTQMFTHLMPCQV